MVQYVEIAQNKVGIAAQQLFEFVLFGIQFGMRREAMKSSYMRDRCLIRLIRMGSGRGESVFWNLRCGGS